MREPAAAHWLRLPVLREVVRHLLFASLRVRAELQGLKLWLGGGVWGGLGSGFPVRWRFSRDRAEAAAVLLVTAAAAEAAATSSARAGLCRRVLAGAAVRPRGIVGGGRGSSGVGVGGQ